MLFDIILCVASGITGALIAWNNSKSSLKAKLDSEIQKASSSAAGQALASFKAKL